MNNKYYQLDEQVAKHPNICNITQCIDRLCASSTIERLPGNCISACDIVQNMLSFYDIQSKIIECQAMVIKETKEFKDFCFVGFTNVDVTDQTVDTHVVVVTQTEPPILIDASIGHLLPANNKILIKVLDNLDPTIIGKFDVEDINVAYHHKKITKLPGLHQKNLIERFKEEQEVKEKYNFVTKILYVLIGIAAYNFVANTVLVVLKIMNP